MSTLVPRHGSHHSRSRRHRTREHSSREVNRNKYQELSRSNLCNAADGNKANLIQGWLDDLGTIRQGPINGAARLPFATEICHHENSPHLLHYPPNLPSRNVTSQSRPRLGQEKPGHKRAKRDRNALDDDDDLVVTWKTRLDHDTDFGNAPRSCHPIPFTEDGLSERGYSIQQREGTAKLSSSGSVHEDLCFQKKRRRKTRADRYDVIKKNNVVRDKQRAKPTKEAKKAKQTKDALVSAREVMDKFNSASILNERITVGFRTHHAAP